MSQLCRAALVGLLVALGLGVSAGPAAAAPRNPHASPSASATANGGPKKPHHATPPQARPHVTASATPAASPSPSPSAAPVAVVAGPTAAAVAPGPARRARTTSTTATTAPTTTAAVTQPRMVPVRESVPVPVASAPRASRLRFGTLAGHDAQWPLALLALAGMFLLVQHRFDQRALRRLAAEVPEEAELQFGLARGHRQPMKPRPVTSRGSTSPVSW